jgi:hypothetical protein
VIDMNLSLVRNLTTFAILAMLLPGLCYAQAEGGTKPVSLTVGAESYSRYPSLEPVTAISVQLTTPPEVYDLMKKAIGPDPHDPKWNCTKPSSYKVAVVSKQDNGTMKEVRTESITYVALQGNDPDTGKRWTYCRVGMPGQVQLIFNSDLGSSETVQVSLVGLPDGTTAKSDGTLKFTQSVLSFSATPQAAPSEKLTNGKTRDTGQLNVSFSDSNLFSHSSLPFNTYVKSTDLFSTDEKDSKSSFSGTLGIQRGIFPRWYAPLRFEETMQGNQTATNLSSVTTLGLTTLLPWAWSGKIFYNSVFQAPLPPDLTINNQYTHRINQNITATSKALAIDDYSLNPVASWSSIRLPWACKVFGWLDIVQKEKPADPAKPGEKGTPGSQYCLGIEMDLGTYYLPLDLTAAKNQRVEGYGDISILLPLTGLSFATKIFPYLTSGDPAKSQIRIKYADSVTPANNYARSKQWTYGIELIK